MNALRTSGAYRWLVLGIIMLGTFMAILDTTIVNVALPHMMATFGVNHDKIEWVVTGFMLTSAVTMTLTAWLADRIGYKALYLGSLIVFTAGSAACALAWNLESLNAARILQAVGAGAIQPIGMAILTTLFAPHERGKALGIWGMGVMLGPMLGPTLGGYLTDWFSWRAIFLVNVPIGIMTVLLGLALMQNKSSLATKQTPFDYWGFLSLATVLIAGLLVLSNGQEKGWGSDYILTAITISVIGLVFFFIVETSANYPLLDLKLFLYRNFSLSMMLSIFRAIGLFGGMFLLPLFLENLVGYSAIQTGLWMMPGAIAISIMMPIGGLLTDKYSYRLLATIGTVLTAVSLFMYGNIDPLSGSIAIIAPQIVRGIGLALMMTPLLTAALNSVPPERVAMASSFMSVAQRIGGSFGIAILNNYVTRSTQIHSVREGELLPEQSLNFAHLFHQADTLDFRATLGVLPTEQLKALTLSSDFLLNRAQVLSFNNGFVYAGLILLIGVPLSLFLKADDSNTRKVESG